MATQFVSRRPIRPIKRLCTWIQWGKFSGRFWNTLLLVLVAWPRATNQLDLGKNNVCMRASRHFSLSNMSS